MAVTNIGSKSYDSGKASWQMTSDADVGELYIYIPPEAPNAYNIVVRVSVDVRYVEVKLRIDLLSNM